MLKVPVVSPSGMVMLLGMLTGILVLRSTT
jgi:hypothetical protein